MTKKNIIIASLVALLLVVGAGVAFYLKQNDRAATLRDLKIIPSLQSNGSALLNSINGEMGRYLEKCCSIALHSEVLSGDIQQDRLIANRMLRDNPPIVHAVGTAASIIMANEIKQAGLDTILVFNNVTDPLHAKLVDSLGVGRENNAAGSSDRLELRHLLYFALQLVPTAQHFGYIHNPLEDNSVVDRDKLIAAARITKNEIISVNAFNLGEIDRAVAELLSRNVDFIVIGGSNLSFFAAEKIYQLTRGKVPLIGSDAANLSQYCLGAIGPDRVDLSGRTGGIMYNIVKKGIDPRDIEVIHSQKLQTMVNLRIAKEHNLKVNNDVLALVDVVVPEVAAVAVE